MGGSKVLEKNMLGRVRKFWFLKGILLWGQSIFPEVVRDVFGKMKKIDKYSIKNNYSNML